MDRKALFFDIDETLLSRNTGEVPESAVKALGLARDQGHMTFVNTGRTITTLPGMFDTLPFDGFLCGCGTYIQYGEEVLSARSIPSKRGEEIIRLIRSCDGDMLLEGREDCYLTRARSRFKKIEKFRDYFRKVGLGNTTYIEDGDFRFDKFIVCMDENTDRPRLMQGLEEDMDIMDRHGGVYEVVPKGYSKATAIAYILEHFHLNPEEIYVFGDSSNDLSMFQYAKHTIAMEHHDPMLDPYTEFITRSVEEDGIYHAMKHYSII